MKNVNYYTNQQGNYTMARHKMSIVKHVLAVLLMVVWFATMYLLIWLVF